MSGHGGSAAECDCDRGRGDISATHASPIARGAPACDANGVALVATAAANLPGHIQMAPTKLARVSFCANVPVGG